MITLTAKIIISEGDNSTLHDGGNSLSLKNNISKSVDSVIGAKKQAQNVFLFGVDKLDGSKKFSSNEGVDYFIGKTLSNANGYFSPSYSITITNSNPTQNRFDYFTIEFDVVNNEHPNTIYVDGTQYTVTSPIFSVAGLNGDTSHTIDIVDWNAPNRPMVITGFYLGLQIDVDRNNMVDISSSIFDRSDLKLPSYGIISNVGDISFNDTDKTIENFANWGILQSGQVCEIRLNNTLVPSATKLLAKMETDQWNYDNDSRLASVSLKDDLEEWQDITVEAIEVDPKTFTSKSYMWLYKHLWDITNRNYAMLSFEELDDNTKYILGNNYIGCPLLEKGTLWQQWTKLCQACMLHIYKDNNGKVVCKYLGGN